MDGGKLENLKVNEMMFVDGIEQLLLYCSTILVLAVK